MLKTLSVKNFRNLSIEELSFSSNLNVIIGDNGQGKTNLLEAIYYLSYGKPFRGSKVNSIHWDKDEAEIQGETALDKIRIYISRISDTKIIVNDKVAPISRLLGKAPSVLFHPAEISLLTDSSHERRNWLDRLVSTIDKKYLFNLVRLHAVLKSRNNLLKRLSSAAEFEAWNNLLADYAREIWLRRSEVCQRLNSILEDLSPSFVGTKVLINYKADLTADKQEIVRILEQNYQNEIKAGHTIFGPHRDDFDIIKLYKDKKIDVNLYGSRAEKRQAVMLLKFSQAVIFEEELGQKPSLILDDVTSELDQRNKSLLLGNLKNYQVFLAATDIEHLAPLEVSGAKIISLNQGYLIS